MIMRAIGHLLGILFSLAGIFIVFFFMHSQSEKADSQFEINMLRDINGIGKDLKETDLDDRTVQKLKYALERVQWNVKSYVQDKCLSESLYILILIPMFMAFFEYVRRVTQIKEKT